MILYPENILSLLEFNQILELAVESCVGTPAKNIIVSLVPKDDEDEVITALNRTNEVKSAIASGTWPGLNAYFELDHSLQLLAINNSSLPVESILDIRLVVKNLSNVLQKIQDDQSEYPFMDEWLQNLEYDENVFKYINQVYDGEGEIKKGVSPELDQINSDIIRTDRQIQKEFDVLVKQFSEANILSQEQQSIADGQRVLAVLVEHKRKVRGPILNVSATGKTVFIEPEDLHKLSVQLNRLYNDRQGIIYDINKNLSDAIRGYTLQIRKWYQAVIELDIIQAKAKIAIKFHANMPIINLIDEKISYEDLKHASLENTLQKIYKSAIGQSIEIDSQNKIMVISGPNAGGKSVTLKSIILAQVMLQSGFLITAGPNSQTRIFSKIFVEIGDSQSIENDLSTYSSHLLHLKYFMDHSNKNTLFIVDELGSGTDPNLGGAIGEAFIDAMMKRGAYGAITTHFGNIKNYASTKKGLVSASMLFDAKKMQPSYILRTGLPGSSYTFEIAKKVGLSAEFLEDAKERIKGTEVEIDTLLANVEAEKMAIAKEAKLIEAKQKELNGLVDTYRNLTKQLDTDKRKLLTDLKNKEESTLKALNRDLEHKIQEIREAEAGAIEVSKIRNEIKEKTTKVKKEISQLEEEDQKSKPNQPIFSLGNLVSREGSDLVGKIEELRKEKALVSFGAVKSLINIKELILIDIKEKSNNIRKTGVNIASMIESFSSQLDVRGKRAEEAIEEVDQQLDRALALGFRTLRIVHGKGNGILRQAIKELVKKYDFVERIDYENPDQGGEGVSIISLR
ncbi:MAG: Smr/MutS family protein [Bacteroidota bacterium]|nr:Smr/MutS family protein [Bacteroidota bacterium]